MSLSTSRKINLLSESLVHKLNLYALAASAAGVGVLALTQAAEAKIVYTPANIKLPQAVYPLDLNHDGINDFSFTLARYSSGHGGYSSLSVKQAKAGNGVVPSALSAGVRVGPKQVFVKDGMMAHYVSFFWGSGSQHSFTGPWANAKNRYLGVEFLINNKVHYGWVRLNVTKSKHKLIEGLITGYAYETIPNKPIIAGKTKGPDLATLPVDTKAGTLGHLALGRR